MYKRLVRVQDGIAHELARFININEPSPDDNSNEDVTIRIEARREKLGVSFLKHTSDIYSTPPFDINVIDDGLLSGTFGFTASSLPRVTFSNVNIEALNCINNIYTSPISKTCTTYNVEDIVTDDWISLPPGKVEVSNMPIYSAQSSVLENNLDNKHFFGGNKMKSLIMRDLGDNRYYLLGNRRSCLFGDFHFHIFLQCTDGYAGGVVRFSNANNYITFLTSATNSKLMQVTDGIPYELATSSIRLKIGRWYKVKISMTKRDDQLYISVFMDEQSLADDTTHANSNVFSKSTTITSKNKHQLFTVGLTNRGCKAVAFTNISLERNSSNGASSSNNKSLLALKLSREGANLLSLCLEHSINACAGDVECCKNCCITAQGYSTKAGNECEYSCANGTMKSYNDNESVGGDRIYNNSEL